MQSHGVDRDVVRIALDTVALASKFTRHFRTVHIADFETKAQSRVAGCVTQKQGPLATDIAMVWVGEIVVKVLSADDLRCVALICSLLQVPLQRMHK